MKLTLIALPWVFSRPEFQGYEGFPQNLGIAYLSAYVEKFGHSVCVIDAFCEGSDRRVKEQIGGKTCYVYGLSVEELAGRVPGDTDIIGISCPINSQAILAERYAAKIKEFYPDKLIVLGGTYAISHPTEALTKNIDVVVRGEGEVPLLDLLNAVPLKDISGILYRHGGVIADNGLAPVVEEMDSLPFPARHLLPMEKYFTRSQRGGTKKAVSITTSRGCPFNCNFCSLHNTENHYARQWRARSARNVILEICQLQERYGNDIALQFEDDNILVDRSRAKELFTMLRKRDLKWSVPSGVMVNLLDGELLRLMKESGCDELNIALESGNMKVLDAMNKKVDLAKAAEMFKICSEYKIRTLAFLMIGYPGETMKSFKETVSYLRRLKFLGLKRIAAFVVDPHDGTPLRELCRDEGYLRQPDDNNLVSIETEDFDAEVVGEWLDTIADLERPVLIGKTRYMLKKILPTSIYQKILWYYRNMRGSV